MLNAIKNDYHLRKVIGQWQNDEDAYIDQWVKSTAEKMLEATKAQFRKQGIALAEEEETDELRREAVNDPS